MPEPALSERTGPAGRAPLSACAAGLAALAAVAFLPGLAAAQPVSQGQYLCLLERTATRLERAAALGDRGKSLANDALGALPETIEVEPVGGGPPLTVSNRELLRELRGQVDRGPEGMRLAAAVLRNLHQAGSAAGSPAPADARKVLAQVLRRPEFRPSRWAFLQDWAMQVLQRVVEWIARVIAAIFERLGVANLKLPQQVQRVILLSLLVLSAGIILYLVARLVLSLAAAPRGPGISAGPEPEAGRPYAEWLAEAEEALRAQDYRGALRALHMAALMRLDEAGHISYSASRTDGSFVRALAQRGRSELAEALSALNRLFALVWYGLRPVGPAEYDRAREHWRQLETMTVGQIPSLPQSAEGARP